MKKIKPLVFLPPFLLCVAVVALNFISGSAFDAVMKNTLEWARDTFGWLVSSLAFCMLVLCAVIYASPFGRTVLGGPDAKPLLTKWQMFAVVLTTNIAIGVLFWGPVEPLNYLLHPPKNIHADPNSPEAALFAISTVYLHWTSTPYAIGSIVGLMFAFAYYNMKKPFSLGAPLSPLLKSHGGGSLAQVIDAACLYALVAAMAAALSGAAMLLGGGVNHVLHIAGAPTKLMMGLIIAAIMATSVGAAISGVTKGIRRIADVNTWFLLGFLALVFFLGPARFILNFAVEGFGYFLSHYFEKALFTGVAHQEAWPRDWTQMQFSAWFAWAPIMGVFLGRIAYGYSVRSFLLFNVLLPAVFTGIWMAVFCGIIVHTQMYQGGLLQGQALSSLLDPNDPSKVLYALLGSLPFSDILVLILLVTGFLSFVTTADGNTDAMSNISSVGISPENPESSMPVKIAWGMAVAVLAWIMVSASGLGGVRTLSTLGGVPSLFLCLGISYCAVRVMVNPSRYDLFKNGYDKDGEPLGRKGGRPSAPGETAGVK